MENIGPNRLSARQYLLITFLITFVVSISTYLYCADYVSYNIWNSVTSKSNKPYISIKTLDLNDTQIDDLKRLGLTPKKSVEIVKPDNSKQTIHGRFLHITDFHIDHHYQKGSDIDKVCHGVKEKLVNMEMPFWVVIHLPFLLKKHSNGLRITLSIR